VAIAAGGHIYWHYDPPFDVTGGWTARSGDAATLEACAETARTAGVDVARLDVDAGVIELCITTTQPADQQARMADLIRSVLDRFADARPAVATSQPMPDEPRRLLAEKLTQIARQLDTLGPGPSDDSLEAGTALVADWIADEAELAEVRSSLTALDAQAQVPLPSPEEVSLDPVRVRLAEQANSQLQAELEILAQREAEWSETLSQLLNGGDDAFERLRQRATDGLTRLDGVLAGDYPPDAQRALKTCRASIQTWREQGDVFFVAWQTGRQSVANSANTAKHDVRLERSANTFIDETAAATAAFDEALASIGLNSDQPTKGLVLRRALARDLKPLIDARDEGVRLARSVSVTDNVDLAALHQRVTGLRRQVADRRGQITDRLRRQAISEQRDQRAQAIAAQRETLTHRADELQQTIQRHVASARAMIERSRRVREDLTQRLALYRRQVDVVTMLAEQVPTASADRVELHALPVRVVLAELPYRRRWMALCYGGAVLLGYVVIRFGIHVVRSSQQNRRAIEAYTRQLNSERKHVSRQ